MKPRLFAEFPAGLAAVSLRLHGGPYCRPPISRMGNKAGYAEAILAALGLRSGLGAEAYAWAEADDDVRALLRCYPDAGMLRSVANIIRGWADEDPRALWERLRAERKARGPRTDVESVAGWVQLGVWSFRQGDLESGGPVLPGDRRQDTTATATATATARLAEYAVASFSAVSVRTMPQACARGETDGDFLPMVAPSGCVRYTADPPAGGMERAARSGWPPVAIFACIPSAADISAMLGTPGDLEGAIIYMDPPYLGTTGYRHDLGREEVVAVARDYAGLGATVCISEAEPIDALEWEAVEVTGGRKGQKRTFSKQQSEWLTMNRTPAHRIARQKPLFGGAA